MNLHPSMTPAIVANILASDVEQLYSDYSDSYKDTHGIRPRWINPTGMTPMDFVELFSSLSYSDDYQAELDAEMQAAFVKKVADLGLTQWCADNNIKTETDLQEYNYQQECKDWEARRAA